MGANLYRPQQGFILVAVLWVLAIMLIAVGIFHSYVERKLLVGIQAKDNIAQILDQESTLQTVLYLLSTNRMTRAGLTFTPRTFPTALVEGSSLSTAPEGDELWVDDTAYEGVGSSLFSVQDSTGLVDINAPDLSNLKMLLSNVEPDPATRIRLLNTLLDYIDSDDLINIGGAERRDYSAKGMSVPTNDYLRSPAELLNVYGWKEWLEAHPQVDYLRWFGIVRSSYMNINAMSEEMLILVAGLSPEAAKRYLVERRSNPIEFMSEYSERFQLAEEVNVESRYRTFPTRLFRLSFWGKGGGQVRVISLQLAPTGLLEPWQVDYEYRIEPAKRNDNEAVAIKVSSIFDNSLGF